MELHTALKPLQLASKLMGLNHEGRIGRLYTFAMFVVVILFLCASCVHVASGNINALTRVDVLILWTQLVTYAVIVAVVLGACIVRPCRFLFPFQEMRQVDTVLRFLGGGISNSHFRRIQILQILLWGLFLVVLAAGDFYEFIQFRSFFVFLHSLYYIYAVSSSIIIDNLFVDYLMVIGTRFSKLNQLLSVLLERSRPSFNLCFMRVGERNGTCKDCLSDIMNIEKLRIVHLDLCGISKKVNGSFGIQLLVTTAVSVVMVTGQLYEAYHFINLDVNPVGIAVQKIIWILFHVGRLFYVSWACSRTCNEVCQHARTASASFYHINCKHTMVLQVSLLYFTQFTQARMTSRIINKVPVHHMSNSASLQIQHFSQQLINENLKFNACGFFNVDFELLCTIVGVVTTYLVILIQMDRKSTCDS